MSSLPPITTAEKQKKLSEKLERLRATDAQALAEQRKQSPYFLGFAHPQLQPHRAANATATTLDRRPKATTPHPHRVDHLRLSEDVYKQGTSLHHKGASVQRLDRAEASFDVDELKRVRLHTLLRVVHELVEERSSRNVDLTREEKHWLSEVAIAGACAGASTGVTFSPPPSNKTVKADATTCTTDDDSSRPRRVQIESDTESDDAVVVTDASPRRIGTLRFLHHQRDSGSLSNSGSPKSSAHYVPLVGATEAVVELLQQPRRTSTIVNMRGGGNKIDALMSMIRADTQADSQKMYKALLEFAIRCAAAPVTQRVAVLTSIADQIRSFTKASCAAVWYMLDDCLIKHDDSDALNVLVPASDDYSRQKHMLLACYKSMAPEADDDIFIVPILVKGIFLGAIVVEDASMAKHQSHEMFVEMLQLQADFAELYLRSQMTFLELSRAQENASVLLSLANRLAKTNVVAEHASGAPLTDDDIDRAEHTLVKSIIQTARDLTDSDRCSVFLVRGNSLQAYFDSEQRQPVTLKLDVGIAGHVARTGETVRLMDAYTDERFNRDIDKQTGYRTRSLLTMPVFYEGDVVAVAQLVNKAPFIEGTPRFFTDRDEELFATFANFVGICLYNLRVNVKIVKERKKTAALFAVANDLARADITNPSLIADIILEGAKRVAQADRGTLFLVDREHDELYSANSSVNIRIPCGTGIAGSVASTGIADIIVDAYADSRFNQAVDTSTGYRTRSMVTVPVRMGGGDIVAIAQLVNRKGGTVDVDPATGVGVFGEDDLQLLEGMAAFAGMALHNAQLVEFAVKAADEATGMLSPGPGDHAKKASFTDRNRPLVDKLKSWWYHLYDEDASPDGTTSSAISRGIDELGVCSLHFDVTKLMGRVRSSSTAGKETASRIVASIIDHYARPFNVPRQDILNFVVACRERYRNVPYHNFFHAVDVVQTVFAFLKVGRAEELLLPAERLALIVASLCHDLDHMGLNNSFYMKTDSPLGILSSSTGTKSVMEVHHCNEAIEILSATGTGIFSASTMTADERKSALQILIRCILATDMQRHKEIVDTFKATFSSGTPFDQDLPEHRTMLMQILLKAADISNVTKPFHISQIWAERVTEEFYSQGDREKEIGIEDVPAMFDRDAGVKLADGQIGFIDFVARPFFNTLQEFDSAFSPWVAQLNKNHAEWKERRAASSASA